jgi:hypothetical protein
MALFGGNVTDESKTIETIGMITHAETDDGEIIF